MAQDFTEQDQEAVSSSLHVRNPSKFPGKVSTKHYKLHQLLNLATFTLIGTAKFNSLLPFLKTIETFLK